MTDWRLRAALSVGQVADVLGLARLHVERAISAGELELVTIAGQRRVTVRSLRVLLREVEPEPEASRPVPPATRQARLDADRLLIRAGA